MSYKTIFNDKQREDISERLNELHTMKFEKDFLHLRCSTCGKLIDRDLNELLPCSIPKHLEYQLFIQIEHHLFHCNDTN